MTMDWKRVVFSNETDDDGNCPVCGTDYAECPCPGPTQDDEFIYRTTEAGEFQARRRPTPRPRKTP